MRFAIPSSPGDLSELRFLISPTSSCSVISSQNRGSTGRVGCSTLWNNAVTAECTVSLCAASSLYGEALCFTRWCPRANLNRCHAWGSRMRGPNFQILGSGDALSWVRAGRVDCTWLVLYRRSRSHMKWDEVFWWVGTDADEATASVTFFCRIWCCNFRRSCFSLLWDLPRSAITCTGALSSLNVIFLWFFRIFNHFSVISIWFYRNHRKILKDHRLEKS